MKNYFSLIKFSHTIFALPFAMLGFFLGTLETGTGLNGRLLLLVLGCMVFARSAAMAFNRYLDRDIDEANPRTITREIPAGKISPRSALIFVIVTSLLFIACTWMINPLCFYLSPVALLVILGYSYTKRFTFLCHFVLGLGLALAPIGAYLAVGGKFDLIPILYSVAVLLWVSGFDIIYALQDEDFDKSMSLNSIPVSLGKRGGLLLSSILHVVCAGIILLASWLLSQVYPSFGWLHWGAAVIFVSLLFYQHTLVKPNDLSKINLAFFTTNGVASLIFGTLVILDIFV
ncbi:UbiA-like polyprenyltransferase [Flavilitoribacter nigricans]|uniref:4-hydroxybenzoate polyprenyltransferase n=1 Tax=Flavilitoribacter nigricans (strain ATCC 23147 / DSM 23189 / NBRC 102662 / NCIMB 1420 / SS-2) TaxID=1122177 RepID=A0A2D0MZH9_FLAN2|nr:UbiA-like polyprenyltransferase [Flavilitoribacter nigricans]PHN01538.1 4-hydroxybenzoate octaprenyltransferase [Flavilitoribacter nigricans DSM 23189 = NBRC 102662]